MLLDTLAAVRTRLAGREADSVITFDVDGWVDDEDETTAVNGATRSTGFPVVGSIDATGAVVEWGLLPVPPTPKKTEENPMTHG